MIVLLVLFSCIAFAGLISFMLGSIYWKEDKNPKLYAYQNKIQQIGAAIAIVGILALYIWIMAYFSMSFTK